MCLLKCRFAGAVCLLCLFLALPVSSPAAPAAPLKYYTVDRASDLLREIDPSTAATISSVHILVSGKTVTGATGLAGDPTTQKLYALVEYAPLTPGSPAPRSLVIINPVTGEATEIGILSRSFADITFGSDGTLYAVTGDGSSQNPSSLFILNKSTGVDTLLVALGNGDDGEAIAYNSTDHLIYHASGTNESGLNPPPATMVFESLDPASPATLPTNIPILGATISEATALLYTSGTTFLWVDDLGSGYPPTTTRLLQMTTTGTATLIGSFAYNATGVARVQFYTVGVNILGTGSGNVTSTFADINCGSTGPTCVATFAGGTQVTLAAAADAGSSFDGWGGDCSGIGSCILDMTADRSVTATFGHVTFDLTVNVTGSGNVTSSPPGINCPDGSACMASFDGGSMVTLTPAPVAGNSFVGWSGGCTGFGDCVVTMSASTTVNGTFGTDQTLTLNKAGTGTGSVTSDRPGINCGPSCNTANATYGNGAIVQLTAVAASGSEFGGWSGGGCNGTGICTVTMNAAQSVTATFTPITGDFNFGATPPTQDIFRGQTVVYAIAVNGINGFNGSVDLSCTLVVQLAGVSCSISPTTVNLSDASATAMADVSITYAATVGPRLLFPASGGWRPIVPVGVVVSFMMMLIAAGRRKWQVRVRFPMLCIVLLFMLFIVGCQIGGGPVGHLHTVVVTGKSGSLEKTLTLHFSSY